MASPGGSDGPDFDDLVQQKGCGAAYYEVEDCLVRHNRDWAKCQAEVRRWRECFARARQQQSPQPDQSRGPAGGAT